MTFAEIALLIATIAVLYACLRPLQRVLERRLYRFFRGSKKSSFTVIDITNSIKKNDPK